MKKMTFKYLQTGLKRIGLLFFCGVIGFLLIILSNLLPVERMRSHIRNGAEILLQNTAQYQYADGYVSAILDNTTEDLILSKVVYQSENLISDAVMAPSYSYPGEDAGGLILFETLNRETLQDANIDTYPAYWHGYLVILRPLFLILTYADFRILNQILELILFSSVIYLMQKCGLGRFIPAFVVMIAFWNPGTMGVSLQYAPCYYLSIGGAIFVLLRNGGGCRIGFRSANGAIGEEGLRTENNTKVRQERDFRTFFMMLGVLTAYFDFLTYPIATFGVPMLFVVLCRDLESYSQNESYMKRLSRLLGCGVWWVAGYVGMWGEKWIYGSFLSGSDILTNAAGKIAERSSAEEGGAQISRLWTVKYLLDYALLKKPYIILMLLFVVVLAVWQGNSGKKYRNKRKGNGIYLELVCIGLLPLIWYFVAANHSYIHPRLVYRAMGVLILAAGVIVTELSGYLAVLHRPIQSKLDGDVF